MAHHLGSWISGFSFELTYRISPSLESIFYLLRTQNVWVAYQKAQLHPSLKCNKAAVYHYMATLPRSLERA